MQFLSHNPNPMIDPNGELVPLPTTHHEQPKLSDLGDLVSKPADNAPSTQSSRWPRYLSVWPLALWYPPRKLTPILTFNQPSHLPSTGPLSSPPLSAFSLFSFTSFLLRHWIYSPSVNTCRVKDWCRQGLCGFICKYTLIRVVSRLPLAIFFLPTPVSFSFFSLLC